MKMRFIKCRNEAAFTPSKKCNIQNYPELLSRYKKPLSENLVWGGNKPINRPSFDSGFSPIVQPTPRGTTHPLIAHPNIFSRTFYRPTSLLFIRCGLPLSFAEGTIHKTNYKTNSATNPPLQGIINRMPKPLSKL